MKMIYDLRKKSGLTQMEFALKIGAGSPQAVSNLERGQAFLAPRYYKKLSRMYGKEVVKKLITEQTKLYRKRQMTIAFGNGHKVY